MKPILMRLHFQNEVPKIKSGLRLVEVERSKRWVYLRTPGSPRRTRVARLKFEQAFGNEYQEFKG